VLLLHVAPATALVTGARAADWAACAALYLLSSVGVGVGLHRYFAHRSFRTGRAVQLGLGVLAGTAFGDPVGFSGKHRLHHRHADTERDVHSPRRGFWSCWFQSLWDDGLSERDILRVTRDLTCYPELRWLHRFFWLPALATAALTLLLGGYSMFAVGFCLSRMAVIHATSAVNYFGHRSGRRRYATPDDSTNNAWLGVLAFGEGWHNNHHRNPRAARRRRLVELDLFYCVIRALAWTGLWDVRGLPEVSAPLPRPPRRDPREARLRQGRLMPPVVEVRPRVGEGAPEPVGYAAQHAPRHAPGAVDAAHGVE
jgi:stearoyl-CoA desaturase (delta-9 desaturase)